MTAEMFGPYRLDERLGHGGMGEVWRAFDTSKNRTVAVKRILPNYAVDSRFEIRFRQESALVAQLTDPHIIPIYDYGIIDERLFITMPLISGTDLGAIISANRGTMSMERCVELVVQVAKALTTAHNAGLVHRDVKPTNILVANSNGDDFAYLIDFGLARKLDATRLTATGLPPVGTYDYIAPERFKGEESRASDIYALGCVIYQALTGQVPFPAKTLPQLIHAHLYTPAPKPSATRPGTAPFDAIVARAMAKKPHDRYPDMAALARAMRTVGLNKGHGSAEKRLVLKPVVSTPRPSKPVPVKEIKSAWSDFEKGIECVRLKDKAGAKVAYSRALKANDAKWSPRAANNLGLILKSERDLAGARKAFGYATGASDKEIAALGHYNLGAMHLLEKDWKAAETSYRIALEHGSQKVQKLSEVNLRIAHFNRRRANLQVVIVFAAVITGVSFAIFSAITESPMSVTFGVALLMIIMALAWTGNMYRKANELVRERNRLEQSS